MAVRGRAMVPSTASRVTIMVEAFTPGCMAGKLYSPYLDRWASFTDVMYLANKLDAMFDEMAFPLAAVAYRRFDKAKKPRTAPKQPDAAKEDEQDMAQDAKNRPDADVFVVHVQFRQNATWQGTVKWAEKNEEKRFRSTLELLKIMDSALTERHPEDAEEDAEADAEAGL